MSDTLYQVIDWKGRVVLSVKAINERAGLMKRSPKEVAEYEAIQMSNANNTYTAEPVDQSPPEPEE